MLDVIFKTLIFVAFFSTINADVDEECELPGQDLLPTNGKLSCLPNFCTASCLPGYEFVNKVTKYQLRCVSGRWLSNLAEIPSCEPICDPSCRNGGICIAPNSCFCQAAFEGETCEIGKKICTAKPPLPSFTMRRCSPKSCTYTCLKGYKFPGGVTSISMTCRDGNWIIDHPGLTNVPECEPTCEQGCQNGGSCIGHNYCKCTKDFRGRQCQFSVTRCSPKKLNFNGGYKCSGDSDSLTCYLGCPTGTQFEFDPAEAYTCTYESGFFTPREVPNCVFKDTEYIRVDPVKDGIILVESAAD